MDTITLALTNPRGGIVCNVVYWSTKFEPGKNYHIEVAIPYDELPLNYETTLETWQQEKTHLQISLKSHLVKTECVLLTDGHIHGMYRSRHAYTEFEILIMFLQVDNTE